MKKPTITAFQYFSSEFKKIINELDEKKGKKNNIPLKMQNANDVIPSF